MHVPAVDEQTVPTRTSNQERLLEIAAVYKNFTRKQLAKALGRDVSNLFPANGNPKLDYLSRLARVLDWPVGDVVEAIEATKTDSPSPDGTFEEMDAAALDAHRTGDYERMQELGSQMALAARTPDERALAALREAGGWDGQGRYQAQIEALRRGLQEEISSPDRRHLLQANLANACYMLGHLFEARAMARELVEGFLDNPPDSRAARASEAFAHYVLGHACRRLIHTQPDARGRHIELALEALRRSFDLYCQLADEYDHEPWRGIANTCKGALLEVEVEAGRRSAAEAVEMLQRGVEDESPAGADDVGDRLESRGWWCIFGCNVALRHLEGAERQRTMTSFIQSGYDVANALGNWAMRERLFTLEFSRRQLLSDMLGFRVDWTINNESVHDLVGTMGRFPSFRSTGWRILQAATRLGSAS